MAVTNVKQFDGYPIQVSFGSSGSIDAFARARMSFPHTIYDSKQLHDSLPLFWDDQQVSGSGTGSTHSVNEASTTMTVSNLTAGKRVRQTFLCFNYEPGKSQLLIFTFTTNAGNGHTVNVGQLNDNNGLFLKIQNGVPYMSKRSYRTGVAVDTDVAQSSWNIDTLDGSNDENNPSGITLDLSKSEIFFLDYEWLGVGTVRMGFFIDGLPYYVHAFNHSNREAGVYMSTPNLPIRYSIENSGAGAAAYLEHICCTVISEGGTNSTGITRGIGRGATSFTTTATTNVFPLMSMRLKSTHIDSVVRTIDVSISCTSTASYDFMLILNPTIGGVDAASWTAVTNSAIEFDISRDNSNTLTNGYILYQSIVTQSNTGSQFQIPITNVRHLGAAINGTRDQIVIAVRPLTGASETFYASATYQELL